MYLEVLDYLDAPGTRVDPYEENVPFELRQETMNETREAF